MRRGAKRPTDCQDSPREKSLPIILKRGGLKQEEAIATQEEAQSTQIWLGPQLSIDEGPIERTISPSAIGCLSVNIGDGWHTGQHFLEATKKPFNGLLLKAALEQPPQPKEQVLGPAKKPKRKRGPRRVFSRESETPPPLPIRAISPPLRTASPEFDRKEFQRRIADKNLQRELGGIKLQLEALNNRTTDISRRMDLLNQQLNDVLKELFDERRRASHQPAHSNVGGHPPFQAQTGYQQQQFGIGISGGRETQSGVPGSENSRQASTPAIRLPIHPQFEAFRPCNGDFIKLTRFEFTTAFAYFMSKVATQYLAYAVETADSDLEQRQAEAAAGQQQQQQRREEEMGQDRGSGDVRNRYNERVSLNSRIGASCSQCKTQ